jgi:lysophospholipase L1-like esterase
LLLALIGAGAFVLLRKRQERLISSIVSQTKPPYVADLATCFTAYAPGHHEHQEHDGLVFDTTIDREGLRADPSRPPEALCRVLAVGASFTIGMWVRDDETWPSVTGRWFARHGLSVRVENAAMTGTSLPQQRIAALSHLGPQRPRVVVLAFGTNDLDDLRELETRHCLLDGAVPERLSPLLPIRLPLRLVPLPQTTPEGVVLWDADDVAGNRAGTLYGTCDEALERYESLLARFADELQERGSRLVVVGLENLACDRTAGASPKGWEAREIHARFSARLAHYGGSVLMLGDLLQEPGMRLLPTDEHPSPAGQRAIGEAVARHLFESGLMAGCGAP